MSPIFNVFDIYAFKGAMSTDVNVGTLEDPREVLKKTIPSMQKLIVDTILCRRVSKKTRRHTYYEYLVQWKGQTTVGATWLTEKALKEHGVDPSHFTTPRTRVPFVQRSMVHST